MKSGSLVDPLALHASGREAEEDAAAFLERSGYSVLARNVRVGMLEIDLVARLGPVVAIIEVRRRGAGAWVKAFSSVDPAKQKRVRRAGERLWNRFYKRDRTIERMRFDIVAVSYDDAGVASCEHVTAAF